MDFAGSFDELQTNVNHTITQPGALVEAIVAQCDSLHTSAARMTAQSAELARRAEQQAASLEETSATMEQMSATSRSSAESAASAADFARDASSRVDEAGEVVPAAVGAMSDIQSASNRIGEIVGVIDGIAFQTNLLALNASVDPAPAGSAGKGFAVVATEVRALAQRSGEASRDIKRLIGESADQVTTGVKLVEETGKTLEEIMRGVAEMSETMHARAAAAHEQATGVGEVTMSIGQLDIITRKNSALSDEGRLAADGMQDQADAMRDLVSVFKTGDRIAGETAPATDPGKGGGAGAATSVSA